MKTSKRLLLFLMTSMMISCAKNDDGNTVFDSEEFFTATVTGSLEPTFNFEATRDGITDYITARTQGGADMTTLSVKGTNFDDFMDIEFRIDTYVGSGTYFAGDSDENPNWIRFGKGRTQQAWWVSNAQFHTQVTTARIVINDSGEFLTGTISFQGYRLTTVVQVDGSFKIRKDY